MQYYHIIKNHAQLKSQSTNNIKNKKHKKSWAKLDYNTKNTTHYSSN